jgi:hypothetical protein
VVLVSLVVAKPSYTLVGSTVIGAADRDDGAERTAVLRGNHLDIVGDRVVVVGVVRVIEHGPYVVNQVLVERWVELRVEQR